MSIDDDWFPLAALVGGFLMGAGAIFVPSEIARTEAIAFATSLITMAGTAYGLRAKYGRGDDLD
jgi:hypothetical protein